MSKDRPRDSDQGLVEMIAAPHFRSAADLTFEPTGPNNTVWHNATVTRERREKLNGHKALVLWFTGLSGSGKSTIAHTVEEHLHQRGCRTYVF